MRALIDTCIVIREAYRKSPQKAGSVDIFSLISGKCELIYKMFQISCLSGKLLAGCRALLGGSAVALYDRGDLIDSLIDLQDGF